MDKTLVDIDNWTRKSLFSFFSGFTEPFFGITVRIDCTEAYRQAKEKGVSFFLYYLYRALKVAGNIENFRYRIIDGRVYLFDQVSASPTINRPDGTFGFAYIDYDPDESLFYKRANEEIQRVRACSDILPVLGGEDVIHFSALPWLNFTALSHARCFSSADSVPKISFGKMTDIDGIKSMPISIHVHHGLMDGKHIGLFVQQFQELMDQS